MDIADEYLTVDRVAFGTVSALRLTLSRPDKLNALPLATVRTLTELVTDVTGDEVDAVVVGGRGDDFCAGVDLADMPDGDAVVEGGRVMHGLVEALRSCPVPVVTATRGRAFGAGFMLCLGADIVVATEDTVLGLQEVNLGIPIAGYVTALLPRTVGDHRARDWLLTGREVSASEASDAGLVSRVVPTAELEDTVAETMSQFESSSSTVISLLKDRMAAPGDTYGRDEFSTVAERELDDMRTAVRQGDTEERLSAFRSDG
jgi:enoyl-CoA hydratase/carnithine racemase